MAHIILVNPELDQVETHKVDVKTFLKVYDLLHPKVEDITEGMTFGQAARTPEIMEAVGLAIDENKTTHPASDPIEDIPAFGDAMANSTFAEPELEPEKAEPAPVNGDKAFADSLSALFAR